MLIIPAIDIKEGKVVRLFQGKSSQETVYSRNPVAFARHWQKQGAELLHVVDLDGAFLGQPKNLDSVKKIIRAVQTPVEFGGGVRDAKTIEALLKIGVRRVVLGTKAVEDREFLQSAVANFRERIVVSIDARDGKVLTKGWVFQEKDLNVIDFGMMLGEIGVDTVIYTDTSKDGTLRGPDMEGLKTLLARTGLRVIASGGVSNIDDLLQLKALTRKGLEGVIVGKALYEEKFTLKEAIRAMQTEGGRQ
jgi:phosphoribosylformimino-5-aminoimidazole carboxamide ribotide isomerase